MSSVPVTATTLTSPTRFSSTVQLAVAALPADGSGWLVIATSEVFVPDSGS
jgi:hypothetical protein